MDDAKHWYVMFAVVDPETKEIVHNLAGPMYATEPYFCSGAKAVETVAKLADSMAKLSLAVPLLDVFARLSNHLYRVRSEVSQTVAHPPASDAPEPEDEA